jgi:ribosomal protein S14
MCTPGRSLLPVWKPTPGKPLGVIRNLGMQQIATREHGTLGELLVFERCR